MDSLDKSRQWIAGVSVFIMFATVIILGLRADNSAAAINSDTLGRSSTESLAEYQQRAAASLQSLDDQELHYALISFTTGLDDAALSKLLGTTAFDGLPRLNAVVIAETNALSLPEPTSRVSRAEVISQQIKIQGYSQAEVIGLVVHATPAQLKFISNLAEVSAIEVLPADATWGHFSVRVHATD